MTAKNPSSTMRASAVLPAAGAYDAESAVTQADTRFMNVLALFISYTRGAANGAAQFKVLDSDDGVTWRTRLVLDGASYASGAIDADAMVVKLPVATGAGAELWSINLDATFSRYVKVIAAEYGVTATPGTLAVLGLTADEGV